MAIVLAVVFFFWRGRGDNLREVRSVALKHSQVLHVVKTLAVHWWKIGAADY